jgi:hypothetical protein
MTLNPLPSHPSHACYVVKLHRDARPQDGELSGRLEHILSGDCVDFTSAQALVDALRRHAAEWRDTAGSRP